MKLKSKYLFLLMLILMSVTVYSAQATTPLIQNEQKILVVGGREQNILPFATGMTGSMAEGLSQKIVFSVPEGQEYLSSQTDNTTTITNINEVDHEKEFSQRPLSTYMSPIIVLFLTIIGYFYFQRKVERKLAEFSLHEAEHEVDLIINTVPDMFWIKDNEGVYLNCNHMFERFFGVERAGIVGKTDYDFVDVELANFFRRHDKAAIAANQATVNEEWLSFADDGHRVLFETTKAPFKDKNGNVIGVLGISHDITSRKSAELVLQESEERFEAIYNNSEVSIWSEDFSNVANALDNLRQEGVTDLKKHLHANIELAWHLAGMIKINSVNNATLKLFGAKSEAEFISQIDHTFGSGAIEVFINELCAFWSNQKTFRSEVNFQTIDGRGIKALISFQIPLSTKDFHNIPIIIVDITELAISTQLLRENEDKYRAMFETSLVGMALNDKEGRLLEVNQAYLNMIGYTAEEVHKLTYWDVTPKSYKELEDFQLKSLKEKGQYGPYEKEYIHKDGHLVPVLLNGVSVIVPEHDAYTWSCIYDITERKQAEQELITTSRLLDESQRIAQVGGWELDLESGHLFWTAETYRIHEVSPESFNPTVDMAIDYYLPESRMLLEQALDAAINKGKGFDLELETYTAKGRKIDVRATCVVTVQDDISVKLIGIFQDISEQKSVQRKLEQYNTDLKHITQYDMLTNLPNRSLLADRLSQAMIQCSRNEQSLAVVFLDLDGFKLINDNHGHDLGDKLLIALSLRMKAALRDGDTLARIGGDEFVAVLADLTKIEDCEPVLERLLLSASDPITVSDVVLNVSASIGVTIYPQDTADADILIRHADQAMYQAKELGRNRYHLFDTAQDYAVKVQRESLEDIRIALDMQQFVLYYQPKVNMRTGSVMGYEALIRWQHPEKGLLNPIDFLPIIENHTMMIEMGEWVIDTALTQISQWKAQAVGLNFPVSTSVNIAAVQLQQSDFTKRLAKQLAAHPDVEPCYLELEVLETSALDDVQNVSVVMNDCMALGVNFALDDFGTGYSSLTYLRRLPASLIKIDQTFVRDMLTDPDDLAIVDGVIGLAQSFKRDVIAEGVETIEHGTALLELGCELAQGYGIAKPMPASDIPEWVGEWKPDDAWKA